MASAPHTTTSERLLPILAVAVLSGVILFYASKIIIPLALAVLLAFVLAPLVRWLQQLKIPRFPAVLVVVLCVLALLYGILHVVFVQIDDLARGLNEHTQTISRKFEDLRTNKAYLWNQIGYAVQEINQESKNKAVPDNSGKTEPVAVTVQKEKVNVLSFFPQVAIPLLELVLILGFIFILVVYILMRPEDLRDRLLRLAGRGQMALTATTLDEAGNRIGRVMLRQLGMNILFGLIFWFGLALIGVPYAFLWGFLAALLRFVPYIGTIVSLLFPLTLCFAVFPGWVQPISVLAFFTIEELLIGYVAEPLFFSESAGISPIALLVAAAFWTWIWGPIGLILSAPLTVCLAVLGRQVPGLQFFDVLLSPREVPSRSDQYYHQLLAHDQDQATETLEEALHECSLPMVCDRLLIPALIQAKQDQARGDIPLAEEEYLLHAMQETFEETLTLKPSDSKQTANPNDSNAGALIMACASSDAADTLALLYLEKTLETQGYIVESVATEKLSGLPDQHEKRKKPSLVFLVAVGPNSLADLRRACKRVRSQVPEVPLVMALWGTTHDREKVQCALLAAGVEAVTFSLVEICDQAESLLHRSEGKRVAS